MNLQFPKTPVERFAAKQCLPLKFEKLFQELTDYFSLQNTIFVDFLREAVKEHFGPFEDDLWDITEVDVGLINPSTPTGVGVYFEFIFAGGGLALKIGAWLYFTDGQPTAIKFIHLNPGETDYEDEPEDDFINSIAPARERAFQIYEPPPGGGDSASGQIENK